MNDRDPIGSWKNLSTVGWTVAACIVASLVVYYFWFEKRRIEMVTNDEIRAKRMEALHRASAAKDKGTTNEEMEKKPSSYSSSEENNRRRSSDEVPLSPNQSTKKRVHVDNANKETPDLAPSTDKISTSSQKTAPSAATSVAAKKPPPSVKPPPTQASKPKKKRNTTKPAHQLLKEALTRAGAHPDSIASLPSTVTDWEELQTKVATITFWKPHASFRELAILYGKLQSERSSSVYPNVTRCLQVLSVAVQKQAAHLLGTQGSRPMAVPLPTKAPWVAKATIAADGNSDNDDKMDLFTAYDNDTPGSSNQALTGPVGDLITLLEQHHGSLSSSFLDWNDNTSMFVLHALLGRIAETLDGTQSTDVLARLTALSTVVSRSTSVRKALGQAFLDYQRHETTGKELEAADVLQPLFSLAGYTLPWPNDNEDPRNVWQVQLQTGVPHFPVGALIRTSHVPVTNCMEFARRVQASAQGIAVTIIRQVMKLSANHKRAVFDWARHVAVSNAALADMLRGELLSPEGLTALSSSWPFLIGICWTFVGLCTSSLAQKLEKSSSKAFDSQYLLKLSADCSWNPLVPRRAPLALSKDDLSFDGATEFFFLSCLLLRSALYPMLRVEDEFHHRNRQVLAMLQDLAHREQTTLPAHLEKIAKKTTSAWFGFDTCLKSREFCDTVTQFTTLQLQWVYSVVQDKNVFVPDWLAKEPPRWLMHVARHHQQHLKPWQAEQVVMVTTKLLTIGSIEGESFSPLVLTELIRVAAAFVAAGVSRARQKESSRYGRRGFGKQPVQHDNDKIIDERSLDSYLSFDASDLGVAVFANELVCQDLCPTLLKTFRALDHVEGLDVDKEASFDKFGVKVEIADLLLRLWGHPNGKCRASILRQPSHELASFASSVAAAIGYLLDDACQRFADVTKDSKRHKGAALTPFDQRDQAFIEGQTRGAVNGFLCGRRLLLLLCRLSMEPKFAAAIGENSACALDMAAMVVHFLDILTSNDGGTNAELDWMTGAENSKALAAREPSMSPHERRSLAASLVAARTKCRKEFGLDVSVLSHQLLALAARWCFPRAHPTKSPLSPSQQWLEALSSNEDCDPGRYQALLKRLLPCPNDQHGHENTAALVFERDGYVDSSIWVNEEVSGENVSEKQKQLRRSAAQEQMSHSEIDAVSNVDVISQFVLALSGQQRFTSKTTNIREEDIKLLQDKIMGTGSSLTEEGYGESLSDWVVSSESFAAPNDGPMQHFFDKMARDNHGSIGSGKTLTKEARKCHKGIPIPHANSAVFVCFAEERMDLCRAIVTGPVDTPYSLGVFCMDVYFPPAYPNIPPLMQWMTTGLLGTFHAGDESQKWNPRISSLAQILLSIQTQLLTSEPYFNEPGHEAMINTQVGKDGSRRYNSKLRLETLRHAIIAQIRDPPKGFEEVTNRHFTMCRQRIVAQARRWTLEARGSVLEGRFVKAYGQLLSLLYEQDLNGRPCLPPLKEDLGYLAREDPSFFSDLKEDRKPSAVPRQTTSATSVRQNEAEAFLTALAASQNATSINPWASNQSVATNPWSTASGTGDKSDAQDSEDNEFYD